MKPDVSLLWAAIVGWTHQINQLKAKIAEAQARIGGKQAIASSETTPESKPTGKKRGMSAEGRARIAEATKRRWEEFRASKARAQRTAKRATAVKKTVKKKATKTMKPRPQAEAPAAMDSLAQEALANIA